MREVQRRERDHSDQSVTALTPTQEGAYSWRPGGIEILEPESMERHNILEMLAYGKNDNLDYLTQSGWLGDMTKIL